jgi:shikimate dehydrogenase
MPDLYFLIGQNISTSPTPRMMNAAFKRLGLEAEYRTESLGAHELDSAFKKLKESGMCGANVTMPHKIAITRLLDSSDEVSSKLGAVNTLMREDWSYRGYNTDVDGILSPLRSRGFHRIGRAAVLGAGGAARAFCEAAHILACKELLVICRDPGRSAGFISSMVDLFPEIKIESAVLDALPDWEPEIFFNASPAGGSGVPLPEQVGRILNGRPTVFDAVYFPVESGLIRLGRNLQCPLIFGHEMLLHQGLKSLQIWTGKNPPEHLMATVLLDTLEGKAT